MKVKLFEFQEKALADLHSKLKTAHAASVDDPWAISFSAPTGSGKTIVMVQLFEDILFGAPDFDAQPDAVILWLSDSPELNAQTRFKIEGKSDRIRANQLVTVDTTFRDERLASGKIYFMNTQKLGSDKKLTTTSDDRQITIWETISNTVRDAPGRFYLVIDEAHRGMGRSRDAEGMARTIAQKFLFGSPQDKLPRIPLALGLSATPQRFNDLLSDCPRTVSKVLVNPQDVRESGLIKDYIDIEYPAASTEAEMTLLGQSVARWKTMCERWQAYCDAQNEPQVKPILVLQVQDGRDKAITATDVAAVLDTTEGALGAKFGPGEVVHTFNGVDVYEVGGRALPYVEPSRIEEDTRIKVVLFKMNLSTGWDCPRAEVMMSFRSAMDYTYIAQLLGRMVRSPLARRVVSDELLNQVFLYLPHYDRKTLTAVVEALKNTEDVPPTGIGIGGEYEPVPRRAGTEQLFAAMTALETYRVDKARKQSSVRRLMGLARGLTQDRLDEQAQAGVKSKVIAKMAAEVQRLKAEGDYAERVARITGIKLERVKVSAAVMLDERAVYTVAAEAADIDRQFEQAGALLSNGLHKEYWKTNADRDAAEVKIEAIMLARDLAAMQALENVAEAEFDRLYDQYRLDFPAKELRRQHYERLRLSTSVAKPIPWVLPASIPYKCPPTAPVYEKHLYAGPDGQFRIVLGTWEQGVLEQELARSEVVGWLRNVDRQNWSLEIPYRDSDGVVKPMYPDLLIVRSVEGKLRFDILEPHDPDRDDNVPKTVGLAEFAGKHGTQFDRIELIRRKRGEDNKFHYYRLNVAAERTRKQVLPIKSNDELDRVFDDEARVD